jgi:serine/threonine-protein kinase
MGTVFLAEDPRLGRFVALKKFAREERGAADARDRVLHEARAVATLTHPNIAAVYDVLELEDQTVIVFEFVEGETLADRLRRGRLPVVEALRIAAQIADGLGAAHARGIVHRDLKPGNVMLTPDGHAKILDFGIARTTGAAAGATTLTTTTNVFTGTPAYAAPEQWLGDPVSPRTDIFALGTVLYEMLGGERPFDADTRLAVMQLVLEAPRPNIRERNAQVPPSVGALVTDMLQRDPQQRPSTAGEVASVLRAIERDAPSSERFRTATVRLPLTRRTWRLAIVAGIVLVAAVAALVASLWRSAGSRPAETRPVVAVLPLANATGTSTNDYIATGVAESLTTSLAAMNGVTVVSRASVASAAARTTEPAAIARDLGATYLIEGSVQLSGNRVRLSVNLVRPDRSVVWGDSVEGLFDDIFALQSRLASAVARALSVEMSPADRARLAQQPTVNSDALAAYYRGRALLERRDIKGNIDAALSAFDEALRLDPNFAAAHGGRGETLWAQYMVSRAPASAKAAIEAGTTALRLDPDSANARYSLAVSLAGSGRNSEAIEELHKALAIQPNYDEAHNQLGLVLAQQGRFDEAVTEFRRAIDLRPNYWGHYSAFAATLFQAARYEDAIAAAQRVVELTPTTTVGFQQLGTIYQTIGRSAEAAAAYERALQIEPTAPVYSNLGALYHAQGDYVRAVDAYRRSLQLRPNSAIAHRNLGDAYARMGRTNDARQAYAQAVRFSEASLAVNPNDATEVARLAVYLAKASQFARARTEMGRALALAPQDVQILYRSAVVHALAGEHDDAVRDLRRAVDGGFSRAQVRNEEDFRALSQLPAFTALVAQPSPGGAKP